VDKQKVYLAGPIEKEKDGGREIRNIVKNKFINEFEFIDPCDFSYNKQFKSIQEMQDKYPDQWKSITKTILKDDLSSISKSDLVIAILNKNAGIGTFSEIVFASFNNIPVVAYFCNNDLEYENLHPWIQVSISQYVYDIRYLPSAIDETINLIKS